MKKVRILSIFGCLLLILIPIVTLNRKPNQVSLLDNKPLLEFRDVLHSGDPIGSMEDYLSSRIGLRTWMIHTYLNLNDRFFGMLMHPTYTYGREGYIFFRMREEILDSNYLDVFTEFVSTMQKDCEEKGITFLYCINPNKTEVYSEYLPQGVHFKFPRQNYLKEQLVEKNVRFIDNSSHLIEAKEDVQVFDVKFDAGHWNDNGAFLGMSNIITELQKDHPEIPSLTKNLFTITREARTYLPLSNFVINDETDVYTRIDPQAVPVTDFDTDVELDEVYHDFTYYQRPNAEELPKILIFRGSYFLGREKFMADHFSEAVFVHSYRNVSNYDYYIDLFEPDIVVFESVEYATKNHYFPSKAMKKRLNKK